MLIGQDFLEAEDKYRREKLLDQNQQSSGRFAKAASVIVVASLVLAACGIPAENQSGATESFSIQSKVVADIAPQGTPDYGFLESYLNRTGATVMGLAVTTDVGVFAGPGWAPNQTALVEILSDDLGVFAGPSWEPNQGRLETYLNPHQVTSGPR